MLLKLPEIKQQCRIDEDATDEEELLTLYAGAAEKRVTSFLNRNIYADEASIPENDPDGLALSDDIKLGMLHLVGHWYENRTAVSDFEQSETPMSFSFLIGPYRYIPL